MFENQRKPGRKRSKEKVAVQLLNFRVTEKEKKMIDSAAKELDTSRSDFVREAIMFYLETKNKELLENA